MRGGRKVNDGADGHSIRIQARPCPHGPRGAPSLPGLPGAHMMSHMWTGIPFELKLSDAEGVRIGVSKGKWKRDAAWYEKDREQDAALAKDFYADSL